MKKIKKINKISWLKLALSIVGVVILGVAIVGISYYGLPKKENKSVRLQQYPQEQTEPNFQMRVLDESFRKSERNYLEITIDTAGQSVNGADLVFLYDKNKIHFDIQTISKSDVFQLYTIENDTSKGILEINAGPTVDQWYRTYSGKKVLLTIPFVLISTENSTVYLDCTPGDTTDTNIVKGSQDVLSCGQSKVAIGFTSISGESGTATPTPRVTATPIPTPYVPYPFPGDYNDNSDNDDSSDNNSGGSSGGNTYIGPTKESYCKKDSPPRPTNLQAVATGQNGQIKLTWDKPYGTYTHFTVTYGERWLDFDYGQPNIGNVDQFYVNGLKNGVYYYFVVTAVNDCASSGYSDGAVAMAGYTGSTGSSSGGYSDYDSYDDYSYDNNAEEKGYEYDYEGDYWDYSNGEENGVYDEDSEATESSDYEDNEYEEYDSGEDEYQDYEPIDEDEFEDSEEYVPESSESGKPNLTLPVIGLIVLLVLGLLFIILSRFAKKESEL